MEDSQPIEAMLHEPPKLHLNNLQLVLPMGRTPRPTFPPLRPLPGERQEWHLHRVPNVEPLTMPSLIGVTGGVRRIGDRWLGLLLQGEPTNRGVWRRFPLGQGTPKEDLPEEIHMRLHPKEGLIDGDKVGDVQHPSWVEMLQLQAPLVEETAQKLMCGVPKPALMECEEGDDLIGPRSRNNLS